MGVARPAGYYDGVTTSLPLCSNCERPARYVWTLESGQDDYACGDCGRPATGVSVREVGSELAAAGTGGGPLTVAAAADRERVAERTVRRWLPALEAGGGAWRVGTHWRIDPGALDSRRTESRRPRPREARRRAKASVGPKPRANGAMGWPDA